MSDDRHRPWTDDSDSCPPGLASALRRAREEEPDPGTSERIAASVFAAIGRGGPPQGGSDPQGGGPDAPPTAPGEGAIPTASGGAISSSASSVTAVVVVATSALVVLGLVATLAVIASGEDADDPGPGGAPVAPSALVPAGGGSQSAPVADGGGQISFEGEMADGEGDEARADEGRPTGAATRQLRRGRRGPQRSGEPQPPAPAESEGLSEAELLQRAQDSLRSSPGRALRLAAEHARRFPGGQLGQERAVIQIEALLRIGRAERARSRAEAFLSRYGSSAHRRRVEGLLRQAEARLESGE